MIIEVKNKIIEKNIKNNKSGKQQKEVPVNNLDDELTKEIIMN
jgi:hypothetical protein